MIQFIFATLMIGLGSISLVIASQTTGATSIITTIIAVFTLLQPSFSVWQMWWVIKFPKKEDNNQTEEY